MIRRRQDRSPIWRDVKRGTPTGISGGYYVMNDGEENPYPGILLQEDGTPLEQEDFSFILLDVT